MPIQPHRIPAYTLAGAISGAASTGLGAVLLRPADADHFHRRQALLAGFVGGAVTHAALGTLAAFGPGQTVRREAAHIGASSLVGCLTSGLVGGAILGATGHPDIPGPGHLILAGAVGGAIVSVASVALGAALCCCSWGLWCGQQATELAEDLLDDARDAAVEDERV